MELPKLIPTMEFTPAQVQHITDVVFGPHQVVPARSDGIFVFGGTHPGSWELASELFRRLQPRYVFVSGGFKSNAKKHASWKDHDAREADVITAKLVERGVPPEVIVQESRSTNSLENVLFLQNEIRRRGVMSLVCVCKSYGVGRQARTIKKHLPEVDVAVVGFDTDPDEGVFLSRDNWFLTENGSARIWGEYLRNCLYARKGDIVADFVPPADLLSKFPSPAPTA